MVRHSVRLLRNLNPKNKPDMCQQIASTIPKYNSSMNIRSTFIESLTWGQMKTLTHSLLQFFFWLRTGQQLRRSVTIVTFFFFRWRYSPLWAWACRKLSLHYVLSPTLSIFSLPSLEDLSTSSLHPFLGLRLVPSSS